jgi:hypothetical protein
MDTAPLAAETARDVTGAQASVLTENAATAAVQLEGAAWPSAELTAAAAAAAAVAGAEASTVKARRMRLQQAFSSSAQQARPGSLSFKLSYTPDDILQQEWHLLSSSTQQAQPGSLSMGFSSSASGVLQP